MCSSQVRCADSNLGNRRAQYHSCGLYEQTAWLKRIRWISAPRVLLSRRNIDSALWILMLIQCQLSNLDMWRDFWLFLYVLQQSFLPFCLPRCFYFDISARLVLVSVSFSIVLSLTQTQWRWSVLSSSTGVLPHNRGPVLSIPQSEISAMLFFSFFFQLCVFTGGFKQLHLNWACLTLPCAEKRAAFFYYSQLRMWNLLQTSLLAIAGPCIYQRPPTQNPVITLTGLWGDDKNASVESSSGLDVALPL